MASEKSMTEVIYGTLEAWFRESRVRKTGENVITMTLPKTGQKFDITVKEKISDGS